MPQFRLRALAPGRWCVGRNPDGSKLFKDFTPEICREQYRRNQELIDAGIPVPVCWEHRDDQRPGRLSLDDWNSERAKGTAGHVKKYEIDEKHQVWNVIEIPDDADGKKAEIVRFCSPEIDRFTDGTGKDWGEVFTHIALTPRPRQHGQPPITRLSLTYTGPLRLGEDDEEEKPAKDTKRKAEDAQDADKKDDSEEKDTPTEFGSLIEALTAAGMVIPEEVKDLAGLIIAIKANQGGDDDPYGPDDPSDVTEVSRQSPISMSHGAGDDADHPAGGDDEDDDEEADDDTPEPPTPARKGKTRMSNDATHPALKKQQEQAAAFARKGLGERINGLVKSGRIPPVVADQLRKEAGKVRLSFSADGDLEPNAVLTKVEAYEALPKGQSFTKRDKRTRMSHAREVEQPRHVTDDGEEADESQEAREHRQKAFGAMVGRQ
jgi:hypothetical protein